MLKEKFYDGYVNLHWRKKLSQLIARGKKQKKESHTQNRTP